MFAGENPAATKTPVRVWIESCHEGLDFVDPVGDVYVAYSDGSQDRWTVQGNCTEALLGSRGMVAWVVCEQEKDGGLRLYKNTPLRSSLRVFFKGKESAAIKTGMPFIEKFRFEPDGLHLVVKSRQAHGPATVERFETMGGKRTGSTRAYFDPVEKEKIPAWARDFAE